MNPRLIGIAGPFKGTTHEFTDAEVTIGRDAGNHLWVVDPALSRRQCLIHREGAVFYIRDLQSRNGTLLNGVPIQEQQLRHGDQIYVGDSAIVFLLEEDAGHHLEKSSVEFAETTKLPTASVLLRTEDAVYLHEEAGFANVPPERTIRDLNALLKIATGIGGIRDIDSLQWQLLGLIFDVVPAGRGAVLLVDDMGQYDTAVAWDRERGPGHPVRVSRSVVNRVVREGVGVIITNMGSRTDLDTSTTLVELGVHSLLCVPLTVSGEVAGVIYLDTSIPEREFDEHHLQVITAVAGVASLALTNVRHWEELERENQDLRAEVGLEHNMIGNSPRIREVFEAIRRVAPTESTVLINGESGTGKELVARAIHRNSPRAQGPFVAINCAAITETLLESELFGHEKGAFTGAAMQKKGKMEVADGGTLFLDEVTELAPGLQAKLLRVLQEREFERVGGTRPLKLNIRLVAATNRNLAQSVEAGTFRKDLFYRLNVVAITMPPLRDRREDIPLLAEHFIAKTSRKCGTRTKRLSPEARTCLISYDWPGNVRELENAIERALVLGVGSTILPDDFPESMLESATPPAGVSAKYHGALRDTKKALVLQALQQANGSYIEAAKTLGMHPNSLLRLIRNLDLKGIVKAGSSSGV